MLRLILLSIVFCIVGNLYSQEIIWGSKQISWEDFSGEIDPTSNYKASTYSQISSWYTFDQDTLSFNITAEFIPKRSWKTDAVNDHLLKHEQIHFDITEYASRIYRKALKKLTFNSYDEIKPKIATLFEEYSRVRKEMQIEYDNDTDHSKIVPRQNKWDIKIKDLLDAELQHSEPKFEIYIGYLKELDHNKPK